MRIRGTTLPEAWRRSPLVREDAAVFRSLSIIATVAGIAAVISHFESAQAERQPPIQQIAWVRTVDGWEPSAALTAESSSVAPSLHPCLVASFQLGVSLFALLAFPSRKSC